MNSLNRRDFVGRIGISAAGLLMLQSGVVTTALAQSGKSRTGTASPGDLANNFASPPFDCGPWVYWFWLDVNVTHAGITADLEAMKAVGIAGVLIMDVDQGTPASFNGAKFGDPKWYELFKFACSEAHRLGMHINMTNDAGWCGSGGPWVTPELSMQRVVWTSTAITGGKPVDAVLPQPPANLNFYRDIAVLAFPTPKHAYAVTNLNNQTDVTAQDNIFDPAQWPTLQADQMVPANSVRDISAHMDDTGRLKWNAPPGQWTVLRFGHTTTGVDNHPAPVGGLGLETDKLSRAATLFQFHSLMERIIKRIGPLAGQTLVSTHIDSWETGSQNWTPTFRADFKRLRGYDIMAYLPVFTGQVVESLEISQRFLWDLRATIGTLLAENYAAAMREVAAKHGLRLSIEGYSGEPANDVRYGGQAAEPMSECWSWARFGASSTVTEMTSAGHVYGHNIIGQETFTADSDEKWQGHPAVVKDIGDWTLCEGINRFVFHRYAMQPWTNPHYAPGMSMGPWGLHYERTETWWHLTKPWHDYVARCCYLLRQGHFVADVCYMQPEGAPQTFSSPDNGPGSPPRRPGYNYDGCPAEAVLHRMEYKNGFLTLPGGMKYRILVLPDSPTMTPQLLRKIKTLVDAGATVIGPRPKKSPSLTNFPHCDAEVETLAEQLWGTGKIATGKTAADVLAAQGIKPDFQCDQPMVRWTHRRTADMDIYFVANGQVAPDYPYAGSPMLANCTFRATGAQPEFWNPETGTVSPVPAYSASGGQTHIPIAFQPKGSVFVVFRHGSSTRSTPAIRSISRDGKILLSASTKLMPRKPLHIKILSATYGVPVTLERNRHETSIVQKLVNDGHYDFPVVQIAAIGGDPDPNVVKTLDIHYRVDGHEGHIQAHDGQDVHFNHPAGSHIKIISVTYGVPKHTKDVTKIVQNLVDAGTISFPVTQIAAIGGDPDFGVVKTLDIHCVVDGHAKHFQFQDGGWVSFTAGPEFHEVVAMESNNNGGRHAIITQPGRYQFRFSSGQQSTVHVSDIPDPVVVNGPWTVNFPAGWGAPAQIHLDKLIAWNKHSDAGVRYFSGTGEYQTEFEIPAELPAPHRRFYLDLGQVAVMARVTLNGQDMGILWKPPFKLDVTAKLKAGRNSLIIQVTNLWINRLIGDQQLPEDCDRAPGGNLLKWPQWLLDGKLSPTGRFTFTTWQLWNKYDPLAESGLIGPVILKTALREDIKI
ncbi:MAG: glycosyl hydrolase [Phycisphaerae bacterium]